MREPDIKHDIKDYLNFPTKSRFSPEDLLRAAHERIDDLEEELEDMEYPDCTGECDAAQEASDDAAHWEDEAGKLRAELDEAMEILRTIFPSDCFLNASQAIRKRAEDLLARHQS